MSGLNTGTVGQSQMAWRKWPALNPMIPQGYSRSATELDIGPMEKHIVINILLGLNEGEIIALMQYINISRLQSLSANHVYVNSHVFYRFVLFKIFVAVISPNNAKQCKS